MGLFVDRRLAKHGASMAQWLVMHHMSLRPGITQTELAGLVGIEPATLGHHLDRLTADGLVERHRSETDRRAIAVTLTATGRRHERKLTSTMESLDDELAAMVTERERAQLMRLLAKLRAGLG
jgi:MarR family transcriptional regulator, transcriptional regulator for hemolysin